MMPTPARLVDLGEFGNLYVRGQRFAAAGDVHEGHRHCFDHVTFVASGAIRIEWRDAETRGVSERVEAPAFWPIPRDRWHRITALEPDTVTWCVFALRDADGEVVDDPLFADHATHRFMAEREEP